MSSRNPWRGILGALALALGLTTFASRDASAGWKLFGPRGTCPPGTSRYSAYRPAFGQAATKPLYLGGYAGRNYPPTGRRAGLSPTGYGQPDGACRGCASHGR